LFLAGCQTGQVGADPNSATGSFAQQLVYAGIPAILSWGRPVYDLGATESAKHLYFELSRGSDLAAAVLACRHALSETPMIAVNAVWPPLRLFADATGKMIRRIPKLVCCCTEPPVSAKAVSPEN
jgi:hypothetical protein